MLCPQQDTHSKRHLAWAEKLSLHGELAEMGSQLSPGQSAAVRRRDLGVWSRAGTKQFWSE